MTDKARRLERRMRRNRKHRYGWGARMVDRGSISRLGVTAGACLAYATMTLLFPRWTVAWFFMSAGYLMVRMVAIARRGN